MSALANLKLVAAKPQRELNPIVQRRTKLLEKLQEQIDMATAAANGTSYAATRSKRVKDEAGNVTVVQAPKRVKAWYWAADKGKVCIAVKYGSKVLELGKGKTAVEVTAAELVDTLGVLKKAVEAGELDTQIEVASASVRKGFKK